MTAKLLPPPLAALLDGNGNPLSGGKLWTYEAGTTNLKSTFTDQDATTAHANPIILNSRGEPSTGGGIFWASGLYDVVLKDSSDVTVWSVDDFDPQVADAVAPADNLVTNGSFETVSDGTNPDNWTLSDSTVSVSTTQRDHGANSLKFTSSASAASGTGTSENKISVSPGDVLDVMFQAYSETTSEQTRFRFKWYQADGLTFISNTDLLDAVAATADTWITHRKRVTVPANAHWLEIEIQGITNLVAGGVVYVDDVRMAAVTEKVTTHTASDTLTGADVGTHLVDASAGDVALTLPAAADVSGMAFTFVRTEGANILTIIAAGTDTIDGGTTDPDYFDAGDVVTLVSDGVSDWRTVGAIADHPLPAGYINGLELANNATDANKDIDIAVGECRDGSDAANMALAATLVKQLDASWAVGTNAGGLDGTESVAGTPDANTWYHVWLIRRSDTGVVDALFSESATAPTMPTNYDQKRRIGAVRTDGSANIIGFYQHKHHFYWQLQVQEFSASPGTTGYVNRTITVPTGLKVLAIHVLAIESTQITPYYTIAGRYGDTLPAASASNYTVGTSNSSGVGQTTLHIETDTSGRYRTRSSHTDGTLVNTGHTLGWIDPRE